MGLSFVALILLALVLTPFIGTEVDNERNTATEEKQEEASTEQENAGGEQQTAETNSSSSASNNGGDEPADRVDNENIADTQAASTGEEDTSDSTTPETSLYQVIRVVDGDTIDASIAGETERIRIIGLDTPETVDPRQTVECFGLEASAKAKEFLLNQQVRLEADPTQGERDTYSRLLRYVFLADGRNYALEMIKQGYGHEYTYRVPHKYQQEYQQAENEARNAERGLWAPAACTDPTSDPLPPEESESPELQGGIDDARDRLKELLDNYGRGTCHSAYEPCLPVVDDLDCSDVQGPITVKSPGVDPYRLDRDNDGVGCES